MAINKSFLMKFSLAAFLTTASGILVFFKDIMEVFSTFREQDLNISANLSPLDGHQKLNNEIFPGGLKFDLVLSHDLAGDNSIVVTDIDFMETKKDPAFICQYKIDSNKIGGAGTEPVNSLALINSDHGLLGKWNLNNKKLRSQGENILNTIPPMNVKLDKSDDSERFVGSFIQVATGMSSFQLKVRYVTNGKRRGKVVGDFNVCK